MASSTNNSASTTTPTPSPQVDKSSAKTKPVHVNPFLTFSSKNNSSPANSTLASEHSAFGCIIPTEKFTFNARDPNIKPKMKKVPTNIIKASDSKLITEKGQPKKSARKGHAPVQKVLRDGHGHNAAAELKKKLEIKKAAKEEKATTEIVVGEEDAAPNLDSEVASAPRAAVYEEDESPTHVAGSSNHSTPQSIFINPPQDSVDPVDKLLTVHTRSPGQSKKTLELLKRDKDTEVVPQGSDNRSRKPLTISESARHYLENKIGFDPKFIDKMAANTTRRDNKKPAQEKTQLVETATRLIVPSSSVTSPTAVVQSPEHPKAKSIPQSGPVEGVPDKVANVSNVVEPVKANSTLKDVPVRAAKAKKMKKMKKMKKLKSAEVEDAVVKQIPASKSEEASAKAILPSADVSFDKPHEDRPASQQVAITPDTTEHSEIETVVKGAAATQLSEFASDGPSLHADRTKDVADVSPSPPVTAESPECEDAVTTLPNISGDSECDNDCKKPLPHSGLDDMSYIAGVLAATPPVDQPLDNFLAALKAKCDQPMQGSEPAKSTKVEKPVVASTLEDISFVKKTLADTLPVSHSFEEWLETQKAGLIQNDQNVGPVGLISPATNDVATSLGVVEDLGLEKDVEDQALTSKSDDASVIAQALSATKSLNMPMDDWIALQKCKLDQSTQHPGSIEVTEVDPTQLITAKDMGPSDITGRTEDEDTVEDVVPVSKLQETSILIALPSAIVPSDQGRIKGGVIPDADDTADLPGTTVSIEHIDDVEEQKPPATSTGPTLGGAFPVAIQPFGNAHHAWHMTQKEAFEGAMQHRASTSSVSNVSSLTEDSSPSLITPTAPLFNVVFPAAIQTFVDAHNDWHMAQKEAFENAMQHRVSIISNSEGPLPIEAIPSPPTSTASGSKDISRTSVGLEEKIHPNTNLEIPPKHYTFDQHTKKDIVVQAEDKVSSISSQESSSSSKDSNDDLKSVTARTSPEPPPATVIHSATAVQEMAVRTAQNTFLGISCLHDLVDHLDFSQESGRLSKEAVCEAFLALAEEERAEYSSESTPMDYSTPRGQSRIKVGGVSLLKFLNQVSFDKFSQTNVTEVARAYRHFSACETLTPKMANFIRLDAST
ncbi:hypothetical protein P154DRAFT_580658 [Amniculicola lignicola CBS 123094]|uniref:Uncharacterized protein n=1 Tax=Amniculicola lignicola CBS 123094 TaxID=1392246 RepID=A0A6A5WD79_9PLEO|nr:hypothetical protein P154DRAFT_580658 [Amniculicola lignicola CBS 123094]